MESATPPGYPTELISEMVLADDRHVRIRPVLPDDASQLAQAVSRADHETLRLRFLGTPPTLDEAMLRHLVEVDYQRRLALVALDDRGHGVGIARYEGAKGDDTAEVGIAVSPGWRRVGLGSELFLLLVQAAVARGIRRFRVQYLADNEEVARLLSASRLRCRSVVSKGVVEAELDLTAPPQPPA